MLGAVIGDIIGSVYEVHNVKTKDFELFPRGSHFTDDTVLSVAVADALMHRESSDMNPHKSYALWYRQYYRRYPDAGYGQMFSQWAREERFTIQRSYGNGGAMRVSAIGYAFDSIREIRREVNDSCYYTHNHKEARRGAEAIAVCIYLARTGSSREEMRHYIKKNYNYALPRLDTIRNEYTFDSRTSYSVPPAIEAFLESDSYEDTIRNAISIGGDSDTIACMAGGIADAYYGGVPEELKSRAMSFLDIDLRNTIDSFMEKFSP